MPKNFTMMMDDEDYEQEEEDYEDQSDTDPPESIDMTGHFVIKKKDSNYIAMVKLFLNDIEGVMWGMRAVKLLTEYRQRVIHVSHIHRILQRMLKKGLIRDLGDCLSETYYISTKGNTVTGKIHIRVFKADKAKMIEEL